MAGSQGIRAGRAFVELYADQSQLVRDLKSAERRIQAWGAGIANVAKTIMARSAAIAVPMLAAAKLFGDEARNLGLASERTGIPADQLSALAYAARKGGIDMEALETGVRKMSRAIIEAATGSAPAIEAFDRLGLTVKDLAALSPDEQFKLIADRLGKVENPTLRAATAMEIFGRSGTAFLPLAEKGAAGIEALTREAQRLGLVMSKGEVAAGRAFAGGLSVIYQQLRRVTDAVGYAIANALNPFMGSVQSALTTTISFVRAHGEAVVKIFAFAAAGIAASVALFVVVKTLALAGAAIHGFTAILTTSANILTATTGVLSMLCTPLGLATAAVLTLGAAWLYLSGNGGKIVAWLSEQFGALADFAAGTFAAIGRALAAGDWAATAEIAWKALQVVWQQGLDWIAQAMTAIRVTWSAVVVSLTGAWAGFLAAVASGMDFVSTAIAKIMLDIEVWSGKLPKIAADVGKIGLDAALDARVSERLQKVVEKLNSALISDIPALMQSAQKMAAAGAELNDAKKALEEAKAKPLAPRNLLMPAFEGVPPLDLEGLAKNTIHVIGTFGGATLSRLGGGGEDLQVRAVKAAEKTAKLNEDMLRELRETRLEFTV